MTITASAAGVRAAVTRQRSLTTAMQLITALSLVYDASRIRDTVIKHQLPVLVPRRWGRIKFSYSGSGRTPRNTTGPMYNKNCLNSVAFQRMTSLNEHGLRANSRGMCEDRLNDHCLTNKAYLKTGFNEFPLFKTKRIKG